MVPDRCRALVGDDWRAAMRCAEALAGATDERPLILPFLVDACAHAQSGVRTAAAKALGAWAIEARTAVPALVRRLGAEPDFLVRKALVEALAAIDGRREGMPHALLGAIVTHLAARAPDPVSAAAAARWRPTAPLPATSEPDRYASGVEDAIRAYARLGPSASVLPSLLLLARSRNFKIRFAAEDAVRAFVEAGADDASAITIRDALVPLALVHDANDPGRAKRLAALLARLPSGLADAALARILEAAQLDHVLEAVVRIALEHPGPAVGASVEDLAARATPGSPRATLLATARTKLGGTGRGNAAIPLAQRLRAFAPLGGRLASTELRIEGDAAWVPLLQAARAARERDDLPPEHAGLALLARDGDRVVVHHAWWLPCAFAEARIVSTTAEREFAIVGRTPEAIVVAVTQPFDGATWGREHFLYELRPSEGRFRRILRDGSTREVTAGFESSAHRVGVGTLHVWQEGAAVRFHCDATPTFLEDAAPPEEARVAARHAATHRAALVRETRVPPARLDDVWELAGLPPLVEVAAAVGGPARALAAFGASGVRVVLCRLDGGDAIATLAAEDE
jgi:hypothetical protein